MELTRSAILGTFALGSNGDGTGGVDDAFARRLAGAACEAPRDAVGAIEALLPPPVLCSRERPFGIHADLSGRACPRCGWMPRRRKPGRPPRRAALFC